MKCPLRLRITDPGKVLEAHPSIRGRSLDPDLVGRHILLVAVPWFRVHVLVLNDPGRLLAVHIGCWWANEGNWRLPPRLLRRPPPDTARYERRSLCVPAQHALCGRTRGK